MPLIKRASKKAISSNIREMRHAGHPENQSVAAALRIADQYKSKGGTVGPLMGATGGRADKLPLTVPDHSHVIPAASTHCAVRLISGSTAISHAS